MLMELVPGTLSFSSSFYYAGKVLVSVIKLVMLISLLVEHLPDSRHVHHVGAKPSHSKGHNTSSLILITPHEVPEAVVAQQRTLRISRHFSKGFHLSPFLPALLEHLFRSLKPCPSGELSHLLGKLPDNRVYIILEQLCSNLCPLGLVEQLFTHLGKLVPAFQKPTGLTIGKTPGNHIYSNPSKVVGHCSGGHLPKLLLRVKKVAIGILVVLVMINKLGSVHSSGQKVAGDTPSCHSKEKSSFLA